MKMMKRLLLILICVVWLTGCSKVTRDNYEKIEMGMDYAEVVALIGEPDSCDAALGAKSCIWGNDTKNIKVKFIADKVALPSMTGL